MLPGMLAAHLLRAARVRAGLTQAELARRAGTSQPVISAYEHGRRDPTVQTLARLLAAAGADLVLRAPERGASDLPPPRTPEEHGRRLLDVLSVVDAMPRRPQFPELDAPRMAST